jgi:hypothetical protein
MIKLLDILKDKKLVPIRVGERAKNYQIVLQKQVQQYMKDGSKGDLNLRGTPLSKSHTKEQIRQMAPGIKGNIYM